MPSPSQDPSFLAGPLGRVTDFVVSAPKRVVAAAVVLAAGSIVIAFLGLSFKTSRLDLLNPRSEYNQRWLAYLDEFGGVDDAVVIVRGDSPDRVRQTLDEIAARLEAEGEPIYSVLHKVENDVLKEKGLHYISLGQLQEIDRYVAELQPVLYGQWRRITPLMQLQAATLRLERSGSQRPPPQEVEVLLPRIDGLIESVSSTLQSDAAYQSPWPDLAPASEPPEHFLASGGKMGFVLARLRDEQDSFTKGSRGVDRLRAILAEVQRERPDVEVGLTGMPILENDEMRASQQDTLAASLLSLVGVTILFIAGFGGIRYPLLTVLALLFAITWSFAYVTLSIGHLNILSVSFGVILIGLGIDFGIHYVARYMQLRSGDTAAGEALHGTAISVGPGVVTGGVTTSIAFCTAVLTDFTGIAELGLIAGGGILLCVLAAITVLPALICLSDQGKRRREPPKTLPLGGLARPSLRSPKAMLCGALLITALLSCGFPKLHYDHNLLNLQPRNLESVRWEQVILKQSDRSVWYALSIANTPAEIRRRKLLFEALPSVQRTEEIVSLLPPPDDARVRLVRRIQQRLEQLPKLPPVLPPLAPDVVPELDRQLERLASALPKTLGETERYRKNIVSLQERLRRQPAELSAARMDEHQQRMAADLLTQLQQLRGASRPAPPVLQDLPAALRTRYVGRSNKQLLKVYARGNIWNMQALEQFVAEVESVDPRVTGHPVQTYYASRQMQVSYIHAACYALLAVAAVLIIDFRSISNSLLAMLPMLLGLVQLFGVLGLLGIPLNPANMIVLPLILGIGIDDGVHVVHDFRQQSGRYRLGDSTATAIVITSATTMVGFGSMMFANHQGLRSLGQVLTIGVFCCLCASVVVLPAILSLLNRRTWNVAEEAAELVAPRRVG